MPKYKTTKRKHSAYNMPQEPGVYIILSPTGRYYIGRSVNMRRRCLAHQYRAKANEEENEILNRSIRKYGWRMKYKVLLQTACEQDAVHFEEQYIRMYWRDGKCMNAKTGDKITGDYNKDHKSKPVQYIHALTGGCITFNSRTEAAQFFGLSRGPIRHCGLLLHEACSISVMDDWNRRVTLKAYEEYCRKRAPYAAMIVGRHKDGTVQRFDGVLHLKQKHGGAAISAFYAGKRCRGWMYRRAFEPWPTPPKSQVQKIGLMVKATHVDTGQVTVYKSINDAGRQLGVSDSSVRKALRKEYKTTANHYINPYR